MPNFEAFEAEVRESLDKHGFSGIERALAIVRLALSEWRSQNLTKERLFTEALSLWDRAQQARAGKGPDLYGRRG